jgi:hypothetical protein
MTWWWCLDSSSWCAGWLAEKLLFPGLIAIVVYSLALKQLKRKRAIDFAERQLSEFYAPMFGFSKLATARRAFDHGLNDASRLEITDPAYSGDRETYKKKMAARTYARGKVYSKMLKHFGAKLGYADSDTQEYFEGLQRLVGSWDLMSEDREVRFVPNRAHEKMNIEWGDENLQEDFFMHLKTKVEDLQREVKGD